MRFFMCGIALLLGSLGLMASGCGRSLPEGQAGYVLVESSVEADAVEGDASDSQRVGRKSRAHAAAGGEEWLTHFELIERSGDTLSSEELRGQPYVVSFFFTLCPSICVNQNGKMQELQEKYRGRPIRFLSISCDPEMDRPPVLAEYAKRFNADPHQWLFLTGDMGYITRVAGEMYSLAAERRFHAEKFVLIDADGKQVGFYAWPDPVQFTDLQHDIDALLAAGGKADLPADVQDYDGQNSVERSKLP